MLVAVFDIAAGLVALAILLYAGARWATEKGLAAFVLWLIRRFPILSANYRVRRVRRRQICPACGNSEKVSIRCELFHRPGGLPMPHVPCNVGL